jgi:hypothetical protein
MKALSIQQPWAWLIVNGFKDVENRDWSTNLRGRVAVHAGKKIDEAAYRWMHINFPAITLPPTSQLERGGIVGTVEITGCVSHSESRWFQGEYGFLLARPTRCNLIPLRGQLGFFEVPEETLGRASEKETR